LKGSNRIGKVIDHNLEGGVITEYDVDFGNGIEKHRAKDLKAVDVQTHKHDDTSLLSEESLRIIVRALLEEKWNMR
jgi:hypothetical protein